MNNTIRGLLAASVLFLVGFGVPMIFEPAPVTTPLFCTVRRHSTAVEHFKRMTVPHDSNYVVDHIVPLCACGKDTTANMQWQRRDSALAKDRWELQMCRALAAAPKDTL